MAKLLPTELIVMIASHVHRSADKLALMLVNHQLYDITKPGLYTNIMLDQGGNASRRGESTRTLEEVYGDVLRLRDLTKVPMGLNSVPKDTPTQKLVVQSLSLELDSHIMHVFLAGAILDLPGLKYLHLSSKKLAGNKRAQEVLGSSIYYIGTGLQKVKDSLESLTVDIDEDIKFRSGGGIGPLIRMTALKRLSVQSHILLHERDDHLCNNETEYFGIKLGRTILCSFLPPNLQELGIAGGMDEEEGNGRCWAHVTAVLLEDLMEFQLKYVPELQNIIVYYPAQYQGFTVMEDCKSECSKYAAKGMWQEVATRLMEMATQERRNISVRYEQG